jgi:hypothetical protein
LVDDDMCVAGRCPEFIFILISNEDTVINMAMPFGYRGLVDMTFKTILIVLLFLSLVGNASSQGYMGTVSTGTGIIPALTVGKVSITASSLGAISSQLNLTGSWSLDLKGSRIRHLDLQIYQENDLILGSGQMSADGSGLAATAAGFLSGDRPTVFISMPDEGQVFRLKLSSSGTSLAGEYDSLSAAGEHESGTVTGSMTLAAGKSHVIKLATGINPSATSGAWVGQAAKSMLGEEDSSSGHFIEKMSIYKSRTRQGALNVSEKQ